MKFTQQDFNTMKKQIQELQNYLVHRITSCNFDKYKVKPGSNGWMHFETEIDGLEINFSILPKHNRDGNPMYCAQYGDIRVVVPDDRLQNLLAFIEAEQSRIKSEKLADLRKQIAELETYEV